MSFSPDGRWLAVSQRNAILTLIDRETGTIQELPFDSTDLWIGFGHVADFSPDGQQLLYRGMKPQTLRWRNLATGDESPFALGERMDQLPRRGDNEDLVRAVVNPSANKSEIAVVRAYEGIALWDAERQTIHRRLPTTGPDNKDVRLSFSPDGARLAVTGHKIQIWSTQTGELLSEFRDDVRTLDCCFSPDGTRLVTSPRYQRHEAVVWDLATGAPVARLVGHDNMMTAVKYSPDGKWIVTSGRDNRVIIWDTTTYEQATILKGHSAYAWCLAFSRDGRLLATGGFDNRVIVWDLHLAARGLTSTEVQPSNLGLDPRQVAHLRFASSGRRIASVRFVGEEVRVLDANDGRRRLTLRPPSKESRLWGIDVSRNNLLAAATDRGEIVVWDLDSGELIQEITDAATTGFLAFSPQGNELASVGNEIVQVYDLTRKTRQELPVPGLEGWSILYSPDGRLLAAGGANEIFVWEIPHLTPKYQLQGKALMDRVYALAFSPDGRTLASGGMDSKIHLWHMNTGEEKSVFRSHSGFVWDLAFTRDGKSLFSAGGDDMIMLWDLESGEPRIGFRAHVDGTRSLALSPDEKLLVTGGLYDNTIRFWHIGERQSVAHDTAR